jgi:hypothetical protein
VVEGAPLLREYTGLNLYRGFESLSLRHYRRAPFPLVRWGCKALRVLHAAGLSMGA